MILCTCCASPPGSQLFLPHLMGSGGGMSVLDNTDQNNAIMTCGFTGQGWSAKKVSEIGQEALDPWRL
jgi:hypothetical protein